MVTNVIKPPVQPIEPDDDANKNDKENAGDEGQANESPAPSVLSTIVKAPETEPQTSPSGPLSMDPPYRGTGGEGEASPGNSIEKEPNKAPEIDKAATEYAGLVLLGQKAFIAGDQRTAEAQFRSAIKMNPKGAEAYIGLGGCLLERSPAQAIDPLKKGLALRHNDEQARVWLVGAYFDSNRTREGKLEIQEYLKLFPNGKHAEEFRSILSTLK